MLHLLHFLAKGSALPSPTDKEFRVAPIWVPWRAERGTPHRAGVRAREG